MSSSRVRTARTAAGTQANEGPLVLDRYRLRRRLGSGAFGTVWMARDERLERDVAVKILARDLVMDGRFEREARAAARLSHPGIVTLFEATVDDEGAYLVSELVVGSTLHRLLADGELSDRDIVEVGVALCDALAHAHEQGVVHRDVKPSNVLVVDAATRTSARAPACKLTDFGVARVIDSDSLTHTGDVIGTLAYMAPEQAAGLEAGEPADLYALALVLYEALTGVNPVRTTPAAQRARRLGAHLPPLRRQRRDLPGPLGAAIDTALAPRPDDRGSLDDLRRALQRCVAEVDDEPGVVAGAWVPGRREDDDPAGGGGDPLVARQGTGPRPAPAEADPSRLIWQARALAGVAAAGIAAWCGLNVLDAGAAGTIAAPVLALLAGGVVAMLPRLGWLATVAYLAGVAAVQGHAGASLLVAIAAALPIVALPAAPCLWPIGALAPALGAVSLAGGWPGIAAWALTPWRRMMLGAVGWLWLGLAAPLAGRALYLDTRTPPRSGWLSSPEAAVDHVVLPLVHSGAVAGAVVWAAGAVIGPWLIQLRSPIADALRAAVWAAALVVATPLAIAALHGSGHVPAAPSAVTGAVAAALLVLAPWGAHWIRAGTVDRWSGHGVS